MHSWVFGTVIEREFLTGYETHSLLPVKEAYLLEYKKYLSLQAVLFLKDFIAKIKTVTGKVVNI